MRFEPFTTSAAETARRLDQLRFHFGKWDLHVDGQNTVAAGALVLDRAEHEDAVRVAEGLYAESLRAQHAISRDTSKAAGLGLDPCAQLLAESQRPGPFVTRVDLFKTPTGWQASECNDDVPGGYNEAIGLPALFHDALPEGLAIAGDLPDALARLLGAGDGPLGIAYATGYAEDLQVVELLSRLLAQDREVLLASPASLEHAHGVTTLQGNEVGGIFRFFPTEWHQALPNGQAWTDSLRDGLHCTNPFTTAWTQSKAFFAWVRQHGGADSLAFARAHLPETKLLDEHSRAVAIEDPQDWVLKPVHGRMGGGVVLGDHVHRDEWNKRLTAAWRDRVNRPFVIQRRFRPEPVELRPGTTATPCIGAYVVDGRFAGYYSRLAAGPLVAYNATNILTVVEGL